MSRLKDFFQDDFHVFSESKGFPSRLSISRDLMETTPDRSDYYLILLKLRSMILMLI